MSGDVLGAILAGGRSSRFGRDKALAEFQGQTLLSHAIGQLDAHCDRMVVVGRDSAPIPTIPDWPNADMGPLAGVAAALRYASEKNYRSVVTCSVDCIDLPDDLVNQLSPPPSYLICQPVIGHWPSDAAEAASRLLEEDGHHSMLAFATAVGGRAVTVEIEPANINTNEDLANLEKRYGV